MLNAINSAQITAFLQKILSENIHIFGAVLYGKTVKSKNDMSYLDKPKNNTSILDLSILDEVIK